MTARLSSPQAPRIARKQWHAAQRAYDRLAHSYDRRWRYYVDATLEAVVKAVQFEGHERVLDLACGTGELERRLIARWPKLPLVGLDVSRAMLEQADTKHLPG